MITLVINDDIRYNVLVFKCYVCSFVVAQFQQRFSKGHKNSCEEELIGRGKKDSLSEVVKVSALVTTHYWTNESFRC